MDAIKQFPIRKSRSNNLILQRTVGEIPTNALEGEVVSIIGKNVIVEHQNNGKIEEIQCVLSGTIIYKNQYSNLISAGDVVYFLQNQNSISKILKIKERITKFSRVEPSNKNKEQIIAANTDTLLIFVSSFEPTINTRLIDRYLISAALGGIEPIICVNKIELIDKKIINDLLLVYKKLGIKVFCISALNNINLEVIRNEIAKRYSVISGPSGAGKSTFLNKLLGYKAQAVNEISEKTSKGVHTTSFSRRYRLPEGGTVIDTPGLREFGIWDLSKFELGVIFPDFLDYYLDCKFTSCTHTHEPNCAVLKAVSKGLIAEERYLSYLNIYETLED